MLDGARLIVATSEPILDACQSRCLPGSVVRALVDPVTPRCQLANKDGDKVGGSYSKALPCAVDQHVLAASKRQHRCIDLWRIPPRNVDGEAEESSVMHGTVDLKLPRLSLKRLQPE